MRPLPAGLDAQATTGVNSLPLTPCQGLGVVALWTAGALLLGALVLKCPARRQPGPVSGGCEADQDGPSD
jgi:hypothetical protein